MMKRVAKSLVVAILAWQVRRLRAKNDFKVVAVAGSIGKTSTKFALASVLEQKYRVRFQEGNYNDLVTVPLVYFGLFTPSLFNPFAWILAFLKIENQLRKVYPYDFVIIELGPDGPGQLQHYARYSKADLGILTALAPEHMEFFKTMDAVAAEELEIANLSHELLVNTDLCAANYLKNLKQPFKSYGVRQSADYQLTNINFSALGYDFTVTHKGQSLLQARHEAIAETQLYSICAAVAVGHWAGLKAEELLQGIEAIKPVNGRMQRLSGINNSIILDDTYNASPTATIAALDTLYKLDAPKKIAILGNMNELGAYSEQAHREIGEHCDPSQLNLVVTIGPDANKYLASAAKAKGCNVQMFDNPTEAGEYVRSVTEKGTLILAKGSQNRVFAEEAVKVLLADPADISKLVRQSAYWLKQKAEQFK